MKWSEVLGFYIRGNCRFGLILLANGIEHCYSSVTTLHNTQLRQVQHCMHKLIIAYLNPAIAVCIQLAERIC